LRIVFIRHHSEGTNMMNTLPKSLAIAFLAVSIFISGLTVDYVGAQYTTVGPTASQRPADLLQSRYLRFGRLNLSHNLVWSAVEDRAGVFCIGTGVGRSRRRVLSV
jgi:hypothetical protein